MGEPARNAFVERNFQVDGRVRAEASGRLGEGEVLEETGASMGKGGRTTGWFSDTLKAPERTLLKADGQSCEFCLLRRTGSSGCCVGRS